MVEQDFVKRVVIIANDGQGGGWLAIHGGMKRELPYVILFFSFLAYIPNANRYLAGIELCSRMAVENYIYYPSYGKQVNKLPSFSKTIACFSADAVVLSVASPTLTEM